MDIVLLNHREIPSTGTAASQGSSRGNSERIATNQKAGSSNLSGRASFFLRIRHENKIPTHCNAMHGAPGHTSQSSAQKSESEGDENIVGITSRNILSSHVSPQTKDFTLELIPGFIVEVWFRNRIFALVSSPV